MKTWEKPKLIVLVRGKPAEAALGGCKVYTPGGGPFDSVAACFMIMEPCGPCTQMVSS